MTILVAIGVIASIPVFAATPDEQFQQAVELYRARLYTTAAQELKQFLDANPNHPQAPIAAYQWAAALYRSDKGANGVDYAAAAAAYEWALNKYPKAPAAMVSAARFELGEAYYYLKKPDKTVAALNEYLKLPGAGTSDRAGWAYYYLGRSYASLKKPALAQTAYEKVRDSYPKSEPAADALLELGLIYLDARKYDPAGKTFTAIGQKYPNSDAAIEARVRLGEKHLAVKDFASARTTFRQALADPKATPYKIDILTGIADTEFADKKWPAAATAYEAVLKSLPVQSTSRGALQLQLGHSYFNGGNWAQALAAYQPLTQSSEAALAAQARYFTAGALAKQEKFSEAAAEYQKFLTSHPKHALAANAALRMGEAYEDAKDPSKAAQAYKLVLLTYGTSPAAKDAQQALTDLASNAGDNDAVEVALRDLPAAATGNARLRLAQNAFQKGEWSKVAQLAQAVATSKPDAATGENALYLVGSAKLNGKDAPGAAAAFRKQLMDYPKGKLAPQARLGLVWALEDQKKWPEAEAAARAAVANSTGPTKDQAHLALGGVLYGAGKSKEAVTAFAAAEKAADKSIVARAAEGRALALEKQQLWKDAAGAWEKYATLSNDPAARGQGLMRRGLALGKAKNVPAALVAFDAAITANPTSDLAAEALYESAWLAQENGQSGSATTRFTRLETDFPESKFTVEAVFYLGETALSQKKWPEAIAAYQRLLMKWPQDKLAPQATYQLATTYYGAGNWAEAAAAFDKVGASPVKRDFAVEAPYWAAESYRKAGDKTAAATRYSNFVRNLESGSAVPSETKAYLPAARLGWGLSIDDPAQRVTIFKPALATAQGAVKTELNFRLGEALAAQGKWAEAISPLLKVTTEAPDSEWGPQATWLAGQALENTGATADALALYRKLAQRQPTNEWSTKANERVKILAP